MASQFPEELKAIRTLRSKYSTMPATRLARYIADGVTDKFDAKDAQLVREASIRTYYSVYSVIRRCDAAKAIKKESVAA